MDSPERLVILVRHGPVAAAWRRRCYGQTDVPLSPAAASEEAAVVSRLPVRPTLIIDSGLRRTVSLADRLASRFADAARTSDPRLRERDYGSWEGQTWDAICQRHPDLHGLIERPDSYAPYRTADGGETTGEMRRRVVAWFDSLPPGGTIVAVTHSGPIASLAGELLGLPAMRWAAWTIGTLGAVAFETSGEATLVRRRDQSSGQCPQRVSQPS